MKWFRMYHEVVQDRKMRRLPLEYRWLWVAVLCVASESPERGRCLIALDEPATVEDIADVAAMDAEQVAEGIEHFERLDMAYHDAEGVLVVTNWDKRQFASDDTTTRVQQWRQERKRQGNVTRNVTGNSAGNVAATLDATTQRTETEDPPEVAADAQAPDPYSPLGLVEAFCEALEIPPDKLLGNPRAKGKAFGIAKRLLENGYDAEDVGACTRWLLSDPWWRSRGVDLGTVSTKIDTWELNGKPEVMEAGRGQQRAPEHLRGARGGQRAGESGGEHYAGVVPFGERADLHLVRTGS